MKKTLTFLSIAFLPTLVCAQLTLNQSSYSAWAPGNDSIRVISNASSQSIGANLSWDLSGATYAPGGYFATYNFGSNGLLPNADFYTILTYDIGTGVNYDINAWLGITASGIINPGISMDHQNISLSSFPGMGPNDSLVFPAQTTTYSSPANIIQFPASYNDVWTSDYNFTTNFNASISLLGLNNAPGYRVTYITREDSVKGWGKMKLKTNAGAASGYMDVLQVKTHVQQIDSFYINGAPVSNTILGVLGLSQGMETHSFTMYYYRANEVTPLLEMDYPDGSFSTPSAAYAHTNRLTGVTGITDIADKNGISVYPNPVINRSVNINIESPNSATWNYELINAVGQKTGTGNLKLNNNKATIKINSVNMPGVYYLQLYKNGERMKTEILTMQ